MKGLLLQLHQHVQDVGHVRGAIQLQRLLTQRRVFGPVGEQRRQDVAGVQCGNGLVDLHQVLPHRPVAAYVQLLVQKGRALGPPLLGVAELHVALWVCDEFLGHHVHLLCGLFTVAGLWLPRETRGSLTNAILLKVLHAYMNRCSPRTVPRSCQCPRPWCSSPQNECAWRAATSEPACGLFRPSLSPRHQTCKGHGRKMKRISIRKQKVRQEIFI